MTTNPKTGRNPKEKGSRGFRIAWAAYDWANNGFGTVILTFVFSAYFTRRVAPDEVTGSTWWSLMAGLAGLCVALGGPFLGAAADQDGRRKPWLIVFTLLCVQATLLLWFIKPSTYYLLPALLLVGLGMVGSDFSIIFYNAMLPELVPENRVGRWSGWGWGLGYAGGLACLLAALLIIGQGPAGSGDALRRIRATFILAGSWYLLFSLPLILLVPDTRGQGKPFVRALRHGIAQLRETFRQVRHFRSLIWFLAARMIYTDALGTIFILGGVYAAGTFEMSERQVLLFGILLNLTAGLGALCFAGLDDKIGPKAVILISLGGLVSGGIAILVVHDMTIFWMAGAFMGLFVGPVQAAGRSYMARASPEAVRRQMFGLYAFSGKATAFAGPLLAGSLIHWSGSQRIGMSTVVVMLITGGLLMLKVSSLREK